MLNKLEFNNLLISNKKLIQQTRTQTINKLVQKLKKLKYYLEKKPDNVKNKERLRKATECMEQLKNLKCADIVRKVLLLNGNPTAILTNGRSTPEEVAIAMLALNKIMQDLAKKFRIVLKLEDNDKSWREEIIAPSKRRVKIYRTEEKRRKRTELKQQKAMDNKRKEWLQINNPEALEETQLLKKSDNGENTQKQKSRVGAWKVEPINELTQANASDVNHKISTGFEAVKKSVQTQKNRTHQSPQENKKKQQKNIKDNVAAKKKKIDAEVVVKQIHKNEMNETNADEANDAAVTHVEDSFFMTETGENYLSTAVINRGQQNGKEDAGKHSTFSYGKTDRNFKNQARNSRNERPFSKQENKQSKYQKTSHKVFIASNDEKLHPSWAAKQKQKPIISKFVGKKITFDDDDNGELKAVSNKGVDKTTTKSQKGADKQQNSQGSDLHPSWAAKQKQKPLITAFQGKKIKFDDQ